MSSAAPRSSPSPSPAPLLPLSPASAPKACNRHQLQDGRAVLAHPAQGHGGSRGGEEPRTSQAVAARAATTAAAASSSATTSRNSADIPVAHQLVEKPLMCAEQAGRQAGRQAGKKNQPEALARGSDSEARGGGRGGERTGYNFRQRRTSFMASFWQLYFGRKSGSLSE